MSFRDDFGGWDPKAQRPELWNLYNGRIRKGEHVRVFPLSNWTELDVWQYIEAEDLEVPSIYFAHEREVFRRDGMLYAVSRARAVHRRRAALHRERPLPHGRRHVLHRRRRLDRDRAGGRRGRDRRDHDHRARRDARRRPASPRPRWRTARLPATSERHGRHATSLRLATAGSVDDGKSTLIGRLLHDAKAILADQLDDLRGRDGELDLSRADRRPARRARAGHHDRRRLPLLRHRAAHVHPGRHARATCSTRATWSPGASTADLAIVLVDARKRRGRADAPPRVHRLAARHPPPRRGGQQDGPRRLLRGGLRRGRARLLRLPLAARRARHRLRPDQRAARRQRRRALRGDAVVRRPAAARAPRDASRSQADRNLDELRFPVQYVIRDGEQRLPRLRGAGRRRRAAPRRRGARAALRARARTVAVDRHLRRAARRGLPAA